MNTLLGRIALKRQAVAEALKSVGHSKLHASSWEKGWDKGWNKSGYLYPL